LPQARRNGGLGRTNGGNGEHQSQNVAKSGHGRFLLEWGVESEQDTLQPGWVLSIGAEACVVS
jgi:hypothetical protein